MPYFEGLTLAARLMQGPLPVREAVRIASDLASALAAAHRIGLVHRDVKPGNVMLTAAGAKLLDFGLARDNAPQHPTAPSVTATAPGLVVGTAPYHGSRNNPGRGGRRPL